MIKLATFSKASKLTNNFSLSLLAKAKLSNLHQKREGIAKTRYANKKYTLKILNLNQIHG